jgi:hypothetical protein
MNDFSHLKDWLKLPDETKRNIFNETGRVVGLPAIAIEKDWWVVHTLSIIFSMECAHALTFKGGTSLSKGWNLIERFSEDIDLGLDREYLKFTGELSNRAIERLRQSCYNFVSTAFVEELSSKFSELGFSNVDIKSEEAGNKDKDPISIEIYYPSLTETETYLKPRLLVEVVSRSLKEPFTPRTFCSLTAYNYSDRSFADKPITLPVVNPERTFLEKIFLLHEEFQKPQGKRRVDRLSRHLYDIEKLSQTPFAELALQSPDLYNTIVTHRRKFTPIPSVDYDKHNPSSIAFIPPDEILPLWEGDYKQMQENMIYGDSLPFTDLINKLRALQDQINNLPWN